MPDHETYPVADEPSPQAVEGDPRETDPESGIADVESVEDAEGIEVTEPPEREDIVALGSWCTARKGSGCTRCSVACPAGAISLDDDGPHIDTARCTRCGLCLGVCDAFAWGRITLEDLYAWAAREAEEEGMACFTCNDHIFPGLAPRSNVMVLPCLAAVPPEFWGALLAAGIEVGIYRDPAYCASCTVAGARGALLFEHALSSAEAWTGRHRRDLDEIPERTTLLASLASVGDSDRRAALSKFATEGVDIALGKHRKRNAGTVSDFHERQERLRARGRIKSADAPAIGPFKPNWPRQSLMVQAAQALPQRAEMAERYCTVTDAALCRKCGCCIDACPSDARRADEDGIPRCDATRCIACGVCVAVCEAGACDYRAVTAAAYLPDDADAGMTDS